MKCPTTGKVCHTSLDAAKAAIASLYRNGKGNPDYRAYRCTDDSSHWHIGHDRKHLQWRIRRALRRSS